MKRKPGQQAGKKQRLRAGSAPRMTSRSSHPDTRSQWWLIPAICLGLAAITWIVFGQTLAFGFVNYDDNDYVYDNPQITDGLTFRGIGWALTHFHADNWHPLTTISHMLDCQLYGLHPSGHHLSNVLLQATAAILLFLALRRLTGAGRAGNVWPSAFVAATFAIHPLRVESVAWISERKDVLSGVFFMLILLAYASYARSDRRSPVRYATVLVLFALGLMCKPTLVTVPFILLLLDYWPLQRFVSAGHGQSPGTTWGYLILEKTPFFVLSAASSMATILAQREAFTAIEQLTFPERISNAVVSYVTYLGQMIYPVHLAVLYPYPEGGLGPVAVISRLPSAVHHHRCFFSLAKTIPISAHGLGLVCGNARSHDWHRYK